MALHDFYGLAFEDGAVGLAAGCLGVDRGLSLSVVWRITKHLKPVKGFLHGWTIEIHRMDEMALFASKILSVDRKQGVLHRQSRSKKAYCWFVVAERALPAMMVALRRVFDRFSSVPRSTFVALSLFLRLFLVRSSIGLR